MRKIAFIGAGSTVFTRNLIGDLLSLPELADTTTFALMAIDAERLRTSETVARGLVAAHGARAGVEESSEHFAEYVPWFIKAARPDLIDRFGIPPDEYLRRCERQIAEWDDMRARIARDGAAALEAQRSVEYGAHIIRACETGEPFAFNGNVPNRHDGGRLVDNLLGDCCVEVPCVAGAVGVAPQPVGALPRRLAALMQTNVNVQGLTVEAALTGRREPAWHAAMLDPHTAGELSLDEIRDLVDALLEAHGDWVPPLATGPVQRAG